MFISSTRTEPARERGVSDVSKWVCLCVCLFMHACVNIYVLYVSMCVHLQVCVFLCVCVSVPEYICSCVYLCMLHKFPERSPCFIMFPYKILINSLIHSLIHSYIP